MNKEIMNGSTAYASGKGETGSRPALRDDTQFQESGIEKLELGNMILKAKIRQLQVEVAYLESILTVHKTHTCRDPAAEPVGNLSADQ